MAVHIHFHIIFYFRLTKFKKMLPVKKESFTEVLHENLDDGIIVILCENADEIKHVEDKVKAFLESKVTEVKDVPFAVYNRYEPHFSERSVIRDFFESLRAYDLAQNRRGRK